ncbi:MAG: AMP-binding protein [Firmicutes bacterium]|nr:AMP-binding protein [Bacillota bacterium]
MKNGQEDEKYRNLLYKKWVKESFDNNGIINEISFDIPDNFNFAYDVVDELAKKCPDKRALVWIGANKERRDFTFGEISETSSQAANYLTKLGIKKGDKVMIVLKRHYQFWIIINALHKIGAVGIPATHLLTKKDFEYRFETADIKAIISTTENDVTTAADEAMQTCKGVKIKATVNGSVKGWHNFDTEFVSYPKTFARPKSLKKTDYMLMYFTSGTTGPPKIAVHNFEYPLGHIMTARYWQNVDPDGLHYVISDTGWAKSVWGKLYGQWLCETAVMSYDFEKFEPKDILPLFKEYQITSFCAPPTMYRFFIKEDLCKYDLSSLKHACIAGEALNPEVYEQFLAATGVKLMEGYGQTEMTLLTGYFVGMEPKPGSMGVASPQYEMLLQGADGKPAKIGEVGEVVLKPNGTPGLFAGYLKGKKVEFPAPDGYYHTGDTARQDEDGCYWFVGRTDDIIKTSGYRVGPFEVESVIMELPYVLECAITGVPDPTRGHLIKATIVLTAAKTPSEELKKEIQEYVKKHTAPYKYPRIVEFVTALPKTISGKIRRVEIREN